VIDYDHIKDYLPVARTTNKIMFAFTKEDILLGQKLSDKKTVFAVNILFIEPRNMSYRKGILRLAPSKFLSLLEPLGYTKEKYVFVSETVFQMPDEFEQVLNAKLYEEMKDSPLGVVEPNPKRRGKKGKK
jgi:hypothetical protein